MAPCPHTRPRCCACCSPIPTSRPDASSLRWRRSPVRRLAKNTVVRALVRLKQHGFLDWIRRTEKTGADGERGPQVRRISNAYYFDASRLPKEAARRLRQLLTKAARRKANAAPAAPPASPDTSPHAAIQSPALRSALEAAERALERNASSPESRNPLSTNKG